MEKTCNSNKRNALQAAYVMVVPLTPRDTSARELLKASIELLRAHLDWEYSEISERAGMKSRQWAWRLATDDKIGTPLSRLDILARVFSDGLGQVVSPSDLFQPDLLAGRLGLSNSVTPSASNRGNADASDFRAAIGNLERADAKNLSIWFDLYTLLARHFERGDSTNVRSPAPPLPKAARSGRRTGKPR